MSLLLDACLNYAFGVEQFVVGLAGLIKLGDLVSDVLFILDLQQWHELFQYSWMFDGKEKANYNTYLICAAAFTAVGIMFDLVMVYMVVKDRERKNSIKNSFTEQMKRTFRDTVGLFFDADDGGGGEWIWWKHANLIVEEIPQLIILFCFFMDYYRGCEYCSDDEKLYMYKLYISAVVSAVFTSLTVIRVSIGAYRAWKKNHEREKQGMLPSFVTSKEDTTKTKSRALDVKGPLEKAKKVGKKMEKRMVDAIERSIQKPPKKDGKEDSASSSFPGLFPVKESSGWKSDVRWTTDSDGNRGDEMKLVLTRKLHKMQDALQETACAAIANAKKGLPGKRRREESDESNREGHWEDEEDKERRESGNMPPRLFVDTKSETSSDQSTDQSTEQSKEQSKLENSFERNPILARTPKWDCRVIDDLTETLTFTNIALSNIVQKK